MIRCLLLSIVLLILAGFAIAEAPKHRGLSAVPFTEVKFSDEFWTPRLEINREKSLPHNFEWCEKTGRISNFAKAGKLMEGKFEGILYNDSDVYKMLEGASYSLTIHPDPKLEKAVDDVIAKIAAAQQPDGYLYTFHTLKDPSKRWTNLRNGHELYCAGHLIEAAVAHFRATGKRTFLDVAVKCADCIDGVFGPTKRHGVGGHEELKLALVKLYQVTGQKKYLELAKFFIDIRGERSRRDALYGTYYQDHLPVREQSEIVGHAVRAMYLCAGATDIAAHTGDQLLVDAMGRLWQDVVRRKIYITGGIGARHDGEAFGDAYELPNESAYCETCAAIGVAFWAHRLGLMHADAQYADVVEQALYNGILSGIGIDGKHFFYVNPLASDGKHHRQPFFKCACCPTNAVRFIPSLPGYVYAVGKSGGTDEIYVNLFVAGEASVQLGGNKVRLKQQTLYPWDGKTLLTVEPEKSERFTLCLRIPAWCKGATLAVNGKPAAPLNVEKGYARLERKWRPGDAVELELPMPIERIEANPRVEANRGRVAVRRGPVVYCFEAVDNGGSAKDIVLPVDPKFTAEYRDDLLGGVTVITGVAKDGRKITAVPYHVWDHREPGEMIVWVRQDGKSPNPSTDEPSWKGTLYRPLDCGG